jgi:DeoR family transcriptional regulator, suf operon transcriptional repressor
VATTSINRAYNGPGGKSKKNLFFLKEPDWSLMINDMSPSAHPALASLSPTRRAMLDALKKRGALDASGLAEIVGVTPSAIRQHLTSLQRDTLVAHGEIKGGAGRPRHVYRLTPLADALYPRAYAELTNELLEYVSAAGAGLLDDVFIKRRQRRIDGAKARLEHKSFSEKIAELTRILDEDGYLAEWIENEDGTYTIAEHNCAILGIAQKYGQACGSEIEFIRAVLPEASVERTAHMVAGAHQCAYLIKPV